MSQSRVQLGKVGEQEAADYLVKKGYNIISKNFRCRIGEIDLIAEYNNFLVFIEVRTRSTNKFGTPAESVTPIKQKRIQKVAQYYLSKIPSQQHKFLRFDVIAITKEKDQTVSCKHYIGAY